MKHERARTIAYWMVATSWALRPASPQLGSTAETVDAATLQQAVVV